MEQTCGGKIPHVSLSGRLIMSKDMTFFSLKIGLSSSNTFIITAESVIYDTPTSKFCDAGKDRLSYVTSLVTLNLHY